MSLLGLLAIAACGGSAEEREAAENACVAGFSMLNEIEAEVQRDSPTCSSAADCAFISLSAECNGSQVSTCDRVVHRDVLGSYSQASTDARFCALIKGSDYGCTSAPSCARTEVACEAGRCIGRRVVAP